MECHMIYESLFRDEKWIWIGRKWHFYILWKYNFQVWKMEPPVFQLETWETFFIYISPMAFLHKAEWYSLNKFMRNAQLCPFLRSLNWGLSRFNRVGRWQTWYCIPDQSDSKAPTFFTVHTICTWALELGRSEFEF